MSNVARLHRAPIVDLPVEHAAPPSLGPAEVIEGGAASVTVRLPDGSERAAQVALAFGYTPTRGDTVLTIGNAQGCWVIGVIAGSGKGVIDVPGDLSVRAGGQLHLSGAAGVAIEGPRVSVRAGALELLARAVTERFESLKQHVVELLSVQAGSTHTTVDGSSFTSAESSTLLTKDKVTINGKAIHLG